MGNVLTCFKCEFTKNEADCRNLTLSNHSECSENEFETDNHQLRTLRTLQEVKIRTSNFIYQNMNTPREIYKQIDNLGEGSFGTVIKVQHSITGKLRAMKIISKADLIDGSDCTSFLEEIKILKNLDHPHVIRIFEYFEDNEFIYIVTDLCESSLFDELEKNGKFSEETVRCIMRQIISAITYLHFKKVTHGDIKLENILCNKRAPYDIRIIDFGCSKFIKKGAKFNHLSGTPYYISPEVLNEDWDEKSDVWSCGVIMYMLLSGVAPFFGASNEEIVSRVAKGVFKFPSKLFSSVSKEAKSFIERMLTYDVDKRITASECLSHPFLKKTAKIDDCSRRASVSDVLDKLESFCELGKFRQAVMAYLTHNFASEDEIVKAKKFFEIIDENGDGRITKKEFKKAYSKHYGMADDEQICQLMKNLDQDLNGYIEFEEFLRASINTESILNEQNLKIAFDQFDYDKSGFIDIQEISKMLCGNRKTSEGLIQKIMNEIDKDVGEELSYEDFKRIMRNSPIKPSRNLCKSKSAYICETN